MEHPGFFDRAGPFPLWLIAETIGAKMTGAGRCHYDHGCAPVA